MTSLPPPPRSRDEGEWGARAPWWCEQCGPLWYTPSAVCTQRGSWEQEFLWKRVCCDCGGQCYENDGPYRVRLVGRRRVLRVEMRGSIHPDKTMPDGWPGKGMEE